VNHLDIVKYLVKKGAYINTYSYYNSDLTPLQIACLNGNYKIVKFLLKNGAKLINLSNNYGSALNISLFYNKFNIFKLLLKNSVNINIVDNKKRTLLHYCAMKGYTKKVLFLIKNGSNKKLKDINGKTAYDLAIENNHLITAKKILNSN